MKIELIGIAVSLFLFVYVFNLIRRQKIRDEYSLIWFAVALFFLIISISRPLIDTIAAFLGIEYGPAALFLIIITVVLWVLIRFSMLLSEHENKVRTLIQEHAILKERLETIEGNEEAAGKEEAK
ncbi:MAG: hypothetical protein A2Z59_08790 [Nitrospinae bacterium RIFCSPLOWO2_02_39_17]|nr:MAG: hypothetical protein A2W53_00515 [Nitrospinae bacterium RIFCSPHIGHO2_02_39_11]OGW06850.1 MAG: hypothetical protein A2Z59_08790 [Nitrospinae bacterium RIFCSPLOWO2_02_39_17]OGW11222.1 MAG: hypothetical protein A2W75_09085 [Nitrospinae bacterium RIFCSPLOWO2_12_39_15]